MPVSSLRRPHADSSVTPRYRDRLLAVVITALAYLAWNWALERVAAPRVAIFLTVQPITGALLGIVLLGDAFSAFTVLGGALIVLGLMLTARA